MVSVLSIFVYVALYLILTVFVVFIIFLPLLRTVVGGLQIMAIFTSRRDGAGQRREKLSSPNDSSRKISDQASVSS